MREGYSILDRMVDTLDSHKPLLERGAGLTFSVFMSGVFSRLIKDPNKETFNTLLGTIGMLMVAFLVTTGVILFLLYHYKGYVLHVPMNWKVNIVQGLCLMIVFLTGFFIVEAVAACFILALMASGTLILLEALKDRWDIPGIRFLDKA